MATQELYNLKRYFANLHLKGLLDVCDSDESFANYLCLVVTDMEQDYQYNFNFEANGTLYYKNEPELNKINRADDDTFMFLTDKDYSELCSFLYHLPDSDKDMVAIGFGLD